MGMPSFSIYAHELIDTYGAKRLIRVGTCGTNLSRFGLYQFAPTATYALLEKAVRTAKELKKKAMVGTVFKRPVL